MATISAAKFATWGGVEALNEVSMSKIEEIVGKEIKGQTFNASLVYAEDADITKARPRSVIYQFDGGDLKVSPAIFSRTAKIKNKAESMEIDNIPVKIIDVKEFTSRDFPKGRMTKDAYTPDALEKFQAAYDAAVTTLQGLKDDQRMERQKALQALSKARKDLHETNSLTDDAKNNPDKYKAMNLLVEVGA